MNTVQYLNSAGFGTCLGLIGVAVVASLAIAWRTRRRFPEKGSEVFLRLAERVRRVRGQRSYRKGYRSAGIANRANRVAAARTILRQEKQFFRRTAESGEDPRSMESTRPRFRSHLMYAFAAAEESGV